MGRRFFPILRSPERHPIARARKRGSKRKLVRHDVVVIGGSAGSHEVLKTVLAPLPANLPAAVFLITHTYHRTLSFLAPLLRRFSNLPVELARDGAHIESGRVYIAPPDHHMLLAKDHIHLSRGPKEGLHRPSINATFRSAAQVFGPRVIGIVLSGMLDDGASGLWEIARHGGVTIVQDPYEALFPSMPMNAVEDAPVDYSLPGSEIAPVLTQLIDGGRLPPAKKATSSNLQRITTRENLRENFSGFTCPECQGPLAELREEPPEFRCRVGHVFQLDNLREENANAQESKLYMAIVALEEGADLADYAANRAEPAAKPRFRKEAALLRKHAAVLRQMLEKSPALAAN